VVGDPRDIPASFDPRTKWPECPSLREIRDQACCGSCWAFGAVTAMSDRICIHSKGKKNVHVSAENLVSCCHSCGHGCHGGYPGPAWAFWVKEGLVSGGQYGSQEGCQPYFLKPPPTSHKDCHTSGWAPTPECHHSCDNPKYNVPYEKDKTYGERSYSIRSDVKKIQMELMTNGPTETSFTVYEDFFHYKTGVYQHKAGKAVGGHAVRLLGWGEEQGTPYWLLANSWGEKWGDRGTFKILRGSDHCGIESGVVAGIPRP